MGLLAGSGIGYGIIRAIMKGKINDVNAKADLALKEAQINGQRKLDEAANKADKIISKAESKNESIKQKKIQEAKDKFNSLRSDFDKERNKHQLKLKDLEVDVRKKETDLKAQKEDFKKKVKEFETREQDIEHREAEAKTIRENLDTQLKIVSKKKEELEAANEIHIKALEKVANLSEAEAKEQLLEAVKAKAETDSMALIKDTITKAKVTANKEAKKIVIQTIQRMCACLLYTSPSPRDRTRSRMPSSA